MTYQDTIVAPAGVKPGPAELAAPSMLVQVFCWAAFLFFAGALTHPLGIGSDDEASGLFLIIAGAFYCGAGLLLLHSNYRQRFFQYLRSNPAMPLALALMLVSCLWSIDPERSLRRSIAVVGTSLAGILIGLAYSRYKIVGFIRSNLAVFVVLSVLLALLVPSLGTHTEEKAGLWRGLMSSKNQMAWIAALFLIFWLSSASRKTLSSPLFLLVAATGALLLYKAGSATGMLATLVGLFFLVFLNQYAAHHKVRHPIVVVSLLGLAVLALLWQSAVETSLELVGRSSTLTGRTTIWLAMWPLIEDRIWLGYGYSAFWSDPVRFFGADNWMSGMTHSHSAYIEVLIDLGVVGVAIQGAFIVGVLGRLWKQVRDGDPQGPPLLAALLTLLMIGLVGVLFFRPNAGTWVMIVAFSAYATERQRLNRERGDQSW